MCESHATHGNAWQVERFREEHTPPRDPIPAASTAPAPLRSGGSSSDMVQLMNAKDELQAEHQEACVAFSQVTAERDQLMEQLQVTKTQCDGLEAMAQQRVPPAELRERTRACDRLQRALTEATMSKTQALERLLEMEGGGEDPSERTAAGQKLEEASALEAKLRRQLEEASVAFASHQ